jgi:hypothetical protein
MAQALGPGTTCRSVLKILQYLVFEYIWPRDSTDSGHACDIRDSSLTAIRPPLLTAAVMRVHLSPMVELARLRCRAERKRYCTMVDGVCALQHRAACYLSRL